MGVEELVGLVGVNEVSGCPMLEGAQMIVSVVAHLMPLGNDLLEQFGMSVDILTHHEKCGFCVELSKCFE